jgi:hypothetical protein
MVKRPRKTQAGIVLPFVLLMLFLGLSVGTTLLFIRYHSAVAGRERALLAYNQSRLIASRPLLDQAMMALAGAARDWAQGNMAGSGYAFGGSSATSVSNALQPLLQTLSNQASALCAQATEGVTIRVYFLSSPLCGSPFPSDGPALPPPRRVSGTPGNLEVYEIPFVAIIEARHDINRRTQRVDGVMRLRVGGGPVSQYQIYLGSGYQPNGVPAYFYGGEVYEGPVHVSGTPNFGPQLIDTRTNTTVPGPFFLGGFSTGRCVATSDLGCVGGQSPVGFAQVGAVNPEAMSPSPFDPCYGASCPRFPGGVDWNAPGLPPPTDNTPPAFEYNFPGTYSAFLTVESYSGNSPLIPGGTPVQRIALTPPNAGTLNLIVSRDGHVVLRREPGENLLAVAPWSSVGWWQNTASGGDGEVVLRNRDGYFGGYFRLPVGTSVTWNASFEADATQANGPVQIGLTYCTSSGSCYNWVGTAQGGGAVPRGESRTATATFTTPSSATYAALWFQIDAPWNNAGTARFRNLSLTASVPVEIPLAPLNFGTPNVFLAQASILRVGGDLDVAGPAGEAAVQGDTSFTLRARGTIRILDNLFSTDQPCNPATVREGKPVPSRCFRRGRGVFGLYSENGDVLLSGDAPANVYVVAAIAAPNGAFGPENLPSTVGVGNLYFQGAFLAQNYRHFLSSDRRSGWRLHFSHDPILSADSGRAPPGWPTLPRGVWAVNVLYTRESPP